MNLQTKKLVNNLRALLADMEEVNEINGTFDIPVTAHDLVGRARKSGIPTTQLDQALSFLIAEKLEQGIIVVPVDQTDYMKNKLPMYAEELIFYFEELKYD